MAKVSAIGSKKKKEHIVRVYFANEELVHLVKSDKDWAVLFDHAVLEIKQESIITYYPIDGITKWTVEEVEDGSEGTEIIPHKAKVEAEVSEQE